MSDLEAGQVIVATGVGYEAIGVDPSTLGVGVPNVNANSLYGNNTGSTAPGMSLTATQARTLLDIPPSPVTVLMQSGIPFIMPASGYMQDDGVFIMGNTPASSATASFSALSGSGVTMTMSAASLLGTSSDVGRVLTIDDGGTFKYATVTTHSSTTVATVTLTGTLSGTGPFANSVIWLTGASPLTATFDSAYAYMPADAIHLGSAADWYYCVMASTTVGTLYDDVYTQLSGTPEIPVSPTAFSSAGPGAYTQVTTSVAGPSVTVTANSMGLNGVLEYTVLMSGANTTNLKRGDVSFGGSSVFSWLMSSTTNINYANIGSTRNKGAANRNISARQTSANDSGDASKGFASSMSRGSINTAVDQSLEFKLLLGVASADWLALEAYAVKLVSE
jgi:hypothetical protein